MKRTISACLCATLLATSACQTTTQDNDLKGAVIGSVFGAITAAALGADTNWLILGTLAGAAAGVLVARNRRTGECAYSNGDGTYYRGPCR